ncbi:hypothetical protein V6Z11_D10G181400 [Gossypium hirsutum]
MDKRGPKSKNPEPGNQGNDEKKSKKGLRLLARVKPSEIFLKYITKDVTNVQITYPCRFFFLFLTNATYSVFYMINFFENTVMAMQTGVDLSKILILAGAGTVPTEFLTSILLFYFSYYFNFDFNLLISFSGYTGTVLLKNGNLTK